jgi:ElaB/YqjD/DUF883 family membrane-anchored ribosome-binding protein
MPNTTRPKDEGASALNRNGGGAGPFIDEAIRFAGTLSARRASGAEQLHMLAQSARGLGETFEDLPAVRDQLDQAAELIDDWAEYIRATDVREMAGDARRFVAEHPYATLAVAVALGLAAGGYAKRRAEAGKRSRGVSQPARRRSATVNARNTDARRRGGQRDDMASANAG